MKKIELDVLMYLRYGEVGEGMDYDAIMDAVGDILSSPDKLDTFCEKCLKNEVYGPYFTKESLMNGLNSIHDSSRVVRFKSVEQAYQYIKTFYSDAPQSSLDEIRDRILHTDSGALLHSLGNRIPDVRKKEWDGVKVDIITDLMRQSFLQNPPALKKLLETGEAPITHKDLGEFWGKHFPEILMGLRKEFAEKQNVVLSSNSVEQEGFEPKLYVSYYGSKHVPENAYKVCLSSSCPDNMKEDMDVMFKSLYPDYDTMVKAHKDKKIDDAEYTRRYNSSVLEKNKEKILAGVQSMIAEAREQEKDIYMFCYCRPGAFCHRYLVNNFLNENGIACQEVAEDRMMYREGHVKLFGDDNYVKQPDLFDGSHCSEEEEKKGKGYELVFSESRSSNYQFRTKENAQAEDVDFTFAFYAVDSRGEKQTRECAGESYIGIELKTDGNRLDLSQPVIEGYIDYIQDSLPEEFFNGESCGINLAGNGMCTLHKNGFDGVRQADIDNLCCQVFDGLGKRGFKVETLRSGGQTGVDQSVAAVGSMLDVPVTVHCTKGWKFRSEDGIDVADKEKFIARFDTSKKNSQKKSGGKSLKQ